MRALGRPLPWPDIHETLRLLEPAVGEGRLPEINSRIFTLRGVSGDYSIDEEPLDWNISQL